MLPHCTDARRSPSIPSCLEVTGFSLRLCNGVVAILLASCAELGNHTRLTEIVGAIGSVPDTRGSKLYGINSKYMVPHSLPNVGLWQEAPQLASALGAVARKMRVRRYLELGIYTAWSTVTIAAFFTRVGGGAPFRGYAVDISSQHLTATTRMLLSHLNVTLVILPGRGLTSIDQLQLPATPTPEHAGSRRSRAQLDFCFIDGDHSYSGVRRDYDTLSASCRSAMFHDIQDTSIMRMERFSGGVPVFWHHLKSRVAAERAAEFVAQSSSFLPMFGIGVLWGGATGTAELDSGRSWPQWSGSNDPAAVWRELCPGGGKIAGSTIEAMRRLCTVSSPLDLNVFVAAAGRVVRRAVMHYAAVRWYSIDAKDNPAFVAPGWAKALLAGGATDVVGQLPAGPFHGEGTGLDAKGGPAKGPLAIGNYLAFGDGMNKHG